MLCAELSSSKLILNALTTEIYSGWVLGFAFNNDRRVSN